jgi:hypothetical protein
VHCGKQLGLNKLPTTVTHFLFYNIWQHFSHDLTDHFPCKWLPFCNFFMILDADLNKLEAIRTALILPISNSARLNCRRWQHQHLDGKSSATTAVAVAMVAT